MSNNQNQTATEWAEANQAIAVALVASVQREKRDGELMTVEWAIHAAQTALFGAADTLEAIDGVSPVEVGALRRAVEALGQVRDAAFRLRMKR